MAKFRKKRHRVATKYFDFYGFRGVRACAYIYIFALWKRSTARRNGSLSGRAWNGSFSESTWSRARIVRANFAGRSTRAKARSTSIISSIRTMRTWTRHASWCSVGRAINSFTRKPMRPRLPRVSSPTIRTKRKYPAFSHRVSSVCAV